LGDSVNIAARLEGFAEPGGNCLSDDAYRQVRDRVAEVFTDLGEQALKNIARPIRVYRIDLNPSLATAGQKTAAPALASAPHRRGRPGDARK